MRHSGGRCAKPGARVDYVPIDAGARCQRSPRREGSQVPVEPLGIKAMAVLAGDVRLGSIWLSHEQCLRVYTNRTRCPGSPRHAARLGRVARMPCWPFSPNAPFRPHAAATQYTKPADWCVLRLSVMKTHSAAGSLGRIIPITKRTPDATTLQSARYADLRRLL